MPRIHHSNRLNYAYLKRNRIARIIKKRNEQNSNLKNTKQKGQYACCIKANRKSPLRNQKHSARARKENQNYSMKK